MVVLVGGVTFASVFLWVGLFLPVFPEVTDELY